jgi:hypothetical protein
VDGFGLCHRAFAVDFLRLPFQAVAKYLLGYLPFDILAIAGPVLRVATWGLQVYQSR